jgi:maltose O-acetyltransferase
VLKDGVVLGFFLAGAQNAPILLEPREKDSAIVIGEKSHLVNGTEIIAVKSVEIGDHCKIGQGTVIIDSDFHGVMPDDRNSPGKTLPVRIGANVWLGNEVMVLKGVSIGRDAVVGARTLVSGDIKDGDVAVGASMRIVKSVLGKECD